ncbi:MAG: cell division protein ZapD [Duodenibacillus sp.]|nr:cell division protein ZapD [Duodenibacillus sp.]
MTERITYEFPCTERVRACLRLEKTFSRMRYFVTQDNGFAFAQAFSVLFEIIELTSRQDLRKEIVQELQRCQVALLNRRTPAAPETAQALLAQIGRAVESLMAMQPRMTSPQSLRDNEWLSMVRARTRMPGGGCTFDLPSLHYWMGRPAEERYAQFASWLRSTQPIYEGVTVLLNVLRSSVVPQVCRAEAGSASFPPGPNLALVQIAMPVESRCIPEVSVNKFKVWVHFLEAGPEMKTPPSRASFDFELGLCAI